MNQTIDVTKLKQYHLGQTDVETLMRRYISFIGSSAYKHFLEGCPFLLVVGITIIYDTDMVVYGFPTAEERERCREAVINHTQSQYKNGHDMFCVEAIWDDYEHHPENIAAEMARELARNSRH